MNDVDSGNLRIGLEAIRPCFLAGFLTILSFSGLAGYVYENDFSVTDEVGRAVGIDVEAVANYSHGWGIVNGGRYLVMLYGSKHFLATPQLRNFRLETDIDGKCLRPEFDVGIRFYFRWNRDRNVGTCVKFYWTENAEFRIAVNDKVVFTRQDAKVPVLKGRVVLNVNGRQCEGRFMGQDFAFEILDDSTERGYIAFDTCFSPGTQVSFGKMTLVSDDKLEKSHVRDWHVELSTVQGMQKPLRYDLVQYRYSTGETEFLARLSGGVMEYKPTYDTKGGEWSLLLEMLIDPYVRFENADGEVANLFFYNGKHILYNRYFCKRLGGEARLMLTNPDVIDDWPLERTWLFRHFPSQFTVAAGYGYVRTKPWCFAENGPYEAILARDGTKLYEGGSLRKGSAAIVVWPTPDRRITDRVPTGIPNREKALRHAAKCGYFSESTPPSFKFDIMLRAADFGADELGVAARVETVFGDLVASASLERAAPESIGKVFRRTPFLARVSGPLSVGVYHFVVDWNPGDKDNKETFIFEVLPDDPNGPCPPLASGLPYLYSIPNEIKDLESSALDPWADFGGVGHYYAVDHHYPAVGLGQHIDKFVPLYRRPWWTNLGGRNCGREFRNSSDYMEATRRANMITSWCQKDGPVSTRGDFGMCYAYADPYIMKILQDYVSLRKPSFKVLTPEILKSRAESRQGLSAGEFEDLFDTCWEDFLAYAKPRMAADVMRMRDALFAINPNVSVVTGGPYSIYVSHYKSPYVLKYNGYMVETDPRVCASGGFYQFEDYHYSCDYPLVRATFFVAGFTLYYPNSLPIYPEIYYQGWGRCSDGAVFNAHPNPGESPKLAETHQRRVVYQYCYGTPSFSRGKWNYWKGYGFHARNPDRKAMEEFMYAWGKMLKNKPARPLRAPYAVLDFAEFSRHGDYLETQCNYRVKGLDAEDNFPDVNNTAEEDIGYAYEKCSAAGYNTPVLLTYSDIDALSSDAVEYLILPPIEASTPDEIKARVRVLHERGVNLVAFEAVDGLEDLFGVKPSMERAVCRVGNETFSHKLAKARYEADGAEVVLFGASDSMGNADVPLFFTHHTATGRTAFIAVPPTVIKRSDFRENLAWGQDTLSKEMDRALRRAFSFVAPTPAVTTERGEISASVTENGDYVVIVNETTPIYGSTDKYPVSFRFKVCAPGIGLCKISADTKYVVVAREENGVTIRAETQGDTANFFRFERSKAEKKGL